MTADDLRQKWQTEDEGKVDAAISALFQHEHGRRLLWWLLELGKVGQQPFSTDPNRTAFSCGELNVGQRILDRLLNVSADGYVMMLKERSDERRTRDEQLAGTKFDPFDPSWEPPALGT